MARQSAAHTEKSLSRRVLVTIKRDMTEITPRVIWMHEKPILEEIHGEGNVVEVDPLTMDEGYNPKPRADMLPYNKTMDVIAKPSTTAGVGFVFIGDPGVEYQRLEAAYGKHPKQDIAVVEKIYGRAQDGKFAALIGHPEIDDLPDAQLRGLVRDYGYAPDPHKEATADEKKAAWDTQKALQTMEHGALVKLAEEVGVQIG